MNKRNDWETSPLCLLELHGVLPGLLEAHITGELHQELEALNVVGEPPVDCLVRLQGLVVVTSSPTEQRSDLNRVTVELTRSYHKLPLHQLSLYSSGVISNIYYV